MSKVYNKKILKLLY